MSWRGQEQQARHAYFNAVALWSRAVAQRLSVRRCMDLDATMQSTFFGLLLAPPRAIATSSFCPKPSSRDINSSRLCPGSGMPISASPCPNPAALAGLWTCRRCSSLARPFALPVWRLSIGSQRQTQARAFNGITRHEVGGPVKVPVSHRLKVRPAGLHQRS
jgi:hypothetical protein